jgi:osmotically-inducible protein OsmY
MDFTDESIKKSVVDHLYWDNSVDASHVTVEVNRGEVSLSGSVPTYFSLLSALRDASEMPGVTAVKNFLEIKKTNHEAAPDDEKILANVENRLFMNSDISISEVDISVDQGEVILTGTVDAYWKKLRVEELIGEEIGVTGIRNQLAVVPTKVYPDQDIAKAVVAALERSALVDPAEITVSVKDATVKLTGSLPNWAAKENAYRAAANTSGVVGVINNLTIMA